MLGFRSLKHPQFPDRAAPDFWAQCLRYWAESETWWDNWAHNFALSVILFPCLGVGVLIGLLLILN